MGRKRAIEELTRIYEATHPVVDEEATPTRERVWSTISEFTDKPRRAIIPKKRNSLNESFIIENHFRPCTA